MSVYKRHLTFREASKRRNHSEVLYLNLIKKTITCVVAKPLVNMKFKYRVYLLFTLDILAILVELAQVLHHTPFLYITDYHLLQHLK